MNMNYSVKRDLRESHRLDGAPGLLMHMRSTNEPPARLIDPVADTGEVISGCFQLARWDSHSKMGAYYPIGESDDQATA
jgi:hypothetical protein